VLRLELPLPEEGRADPNRDVRTLRRDGVRYVVVTGAIADRVLAAREHYPHETAFYEDLRRMKRLFYRAADGLNGPWVAVYGL
jgi:hypothetical protein